MKISVKRLREIVMEEVAKGAVTADDLYLAEMFDTTSAGTSHDPTGTTQQSPAQKACADATNNKGTLTPAGCIDERGQPVALEESLNIEIVDDE